MTKIFKNNHTKILIISVDNLNNERKLPMILRSISLVIDIIIHFSHKFVF